MHLEAHAAVAALAGELGYRARPEISILDVGGRNINGQVRDLFASTDWTVLDNVAAAGVDIVADARTWTPTRTWDLVVCTEVLEHVDDWRAVLATCARAAGEAVIVTCASTGRPAHSQTGDAHIPPGEHYGNVPVDQLDLMLAGLFADHKVAFGAGGDAYGWGRH